MTQIENKTKQEITNLMSEVSELEQIIKETTGKWYTDPNLCQCDKDDCDFLCKRSQLYRKMMEEDRDFCFWMFSGLRDHALEVIKELDGKMIYELFKIQKNLLDNESSNENVAMKPEFAR